MAKCCCEGCKEVNAKDNGGENENRVFSLIKLASSTVLLVLALFFIENQTAKLILYIIAALICGYEMLFKCIKNIIHLQFFDENTLMIIASTVAFVLGEFFEGVLIILLYNLGEFLEDLATDRSREKIAGLAELKSYTVNLICGKDVKTVEPDDVEIGSLIMIKKGERVPIDSVLIDLNAEFDLKDVTGESKFYSLKQGDPIFGGAINVGDAVICKTTKKYKDSTVEKIIEMVEKSADRKAQSQKFITMFAKIYTPCVVGLSLLIAVIPPLFDSYNFSKWIYKALTFLIVSCPCALVISVPLGFFIGIGSLAKKGILVKGGSFIESLSKADTVVFDKTGTLTTGKFQIKSIQTFSEYSEDEILNIAASIENSSTHPLAKCIISCNKEESLPVSEIKEYSGKGMEGVFDGEKFFVGNEALLKDNGISVEGAETYKDDTVIFIAKENKLLGLISFKDEIKSEAEYLVNNLNNVGVKNTAIISGDNKTVAEAVGDILGIKDVYAGLLPKEKVDKLSEIMKRTNGKVVYCGDGVNDSPSIALADVGLAMGALGSEAAIDCADVIITDDNLNKIPYSVKKSKSIMKKVKVNIIGSIAVKIAFMILGVLTPLPVYIAMIGDVGVMLLAVLNSISIGFKDKHERLA